MGGVDLDPVETGGRGPPGGLDEIPDKAVDFALGHFPGRDLGDGIGNGRGGEGDAPRQAFLGLAAGVGDLEEDLGGRPVDRLGNRPEELDEAVVVGGRLAGAGDARAVDIGVAGDDQPDASLGQGPV